MTQGSFVTTRVKGKPWAVRFTGRRPVRLPFGADDHAAFVDRRSRSRALHRNMDQHGPRRKACGGRAPTLVAELMMSGDQSVALLPLLTALAAVAALLSAALTAGLFAAFSIAVMPALNAEPPAVATATMRRINKVILRPTFFVAFFGGPLFAAVAALLSPRAAAVPFWVAASVLLLGSQRAAQPGAGPRRRGRRADAVRRLCPRLDVLERPARAGRAGGGGGDRRGADARGLSPSA
jgi:hypothetical protein